MILDKQNGITEKIIQCFYSVYNELGYGFLEAVYQNAMYYALKDLGFKVENEKEIIVHFDGRVVGKYRADFLINNAVIVELKTAETLLLEHELQLVNYLRATDIEVGLLLNFGKKPQIKRKIFDNEMKNLCESV